MSSIVHSFHKRASLPVSQPHSSSSLPSKEQGLRRRLSSLSLKIQPICSTTAATWAVLRSSESVSSMGEHAGTSLRKWWQWGWSWILSRKPVFAKDLEMNDEETAILGCHNKGSWRLLFYRLKSELKKLLGSDKVGLPQTCGHDSYNYSKNFDDGITTSTTTH